MVSELALPSVSLKKVPYVGILDVRADSVEQTCSLINQQGGQAIPLVVDLRNEDQVNLAVAQLTQSVGHVDALINNAAIMPSGVLHETYNSGLG
jgi:NADP-dependent 3-hydroxy acid dehydrogenase YdfG